MENMDDFKDVQANIDGLPYTTAMNFQSNKSPMHALHKVKRCMYTFTQKMGMSVLEYREKFKAMVKIIETIGRSFGKRKYGIT